MSVGKATILIVDDEDLIRWSLSEFLKGRGWQSITAEDGEEAVEKFQEHRPNLVLLDLMLPGIDGLTVLKRIKEIDASVPVIMMTAVSHAENTARAMESGVFDCVDKPFDLPDVQAKIARALERKEPSRG